MGADADNLQGLVKHGIVAGSNIKAGVRGLKIKETLYSGTHLQVYTEENFPDYYNVEEFNSNVRVALILSHHSFEAFYYSGYDASNNALHFEKLEDVVILPDYVELAKNDDGTLMENGNYLWFYTVKEEDGLTIYDTSLNDNAPIRPEVDYTYGFGDNINIVGKGSFSSGVYNQNMGSYSATIGRSNTAYYAGFALGGFNKAMGTYSVALNQITEATGTASTSKGYLTKATANYAEAGGQETEANHKASFTHGLRTKSGRDSQTVVGEYNKVNDTALFVVGNGSGNLTLSDSYIIEHTNKNKINLKHSNIIEGTSHADSTRLGYDTRITLSNKSAIFAKIKAFDIFGNAIELALTQDCMICTSNESNGLFSATSDTCGIDLRTTGAVEYSVYLSNLKQRYSSNFKIEFDLTSFGGAANNVRMSFSPGLSGEIRHRLMFQDGAWYTNPNGSYASQGSCGFNLRYSGGSNLWTEESPFTMHCIFIYENGVAKLATDKNSTIFTYDIKSTYGDEYNNFVIDPMIIVRIAYFRFSNVVITNLN